MQTSPENQEFVVKILGELLDYAEDVAAERDERPACIQYARAIMEASRTVGTA